MGCEKPPGIRDEPMQQDPVGEKRSQPGEIDPRGIKGEHGPSDALGSPLNRTNFFL